MDDKVRDYLRELGRRGGRASRRTLSSEDARKMVKVRAARRLYREFHTRCFWSYDPDYRVTTTDIDWVAQQLREHGGRAGWEAAVKLCR